MRNSQNFWDKNAGRYDHFMRKDAAAYEQLYELLRPVVRQKTVLELATGTGLIAKHIVHYAAGWLRSVCAVGVSGGKEISQGMPPDPDRHRETDVPDSCGMERGEVRCTGTECPWQCGQYLQSHLKSN